MSERVPMTRQGYDKLEADLRELKTVDRPQIVKEIEIARAHGDISENAEFHAAKERQSHIEGRIRQLEDKLARAQVIDPSGPAPDSVRFGVTVVLLDAETEEEVTYTLVGEDESDIAKGPALDLLADRARPAREGRRRRRARPGTQGNPRIRGARDPVRVTGSRERADVMVGRPGGSGPISSHRKLKEGCALPRTR